MEPDRLRGAGLVAAAALCWSTGGILVRLVTVDPWTIVFWRSSFVALAIVAFLRLRTGPGPWPAIRATGAMGVLSGLLLAGAFTCFILALSHTTVANALVIASAAPLVSAVLGRLVLGEALLVRTVATIAVAVGGIAIMFSESFAGASLAGNLLALAVAVLFGTNIVVVRANRKVDMVPAMALAGLFSALAALPMASPLTVSAGDLALLATMGLFQVSFGFFLFIRGAVRLSAAEVGLITLLETVLAPLWVWVGVGEVPSVLALTGGAIVLLALIGHSALGVRRSKPPVGMV